MLISQQPALTDCARVFVSADPVSPLIFILSPGVDPIKELFQFAENHGFGSPDKCFSLSLGQGQGQIAENAIRDVSVMWRACRPSFNAQTAASHAVMHLIVLGPSLLWLTYF